MVFLTEQGQEELNGWFGLVVVTVVLAWAGAAAATELGRSAVVSARRVFAWLARKATGRAPHIAARRRHARTAFVMFLVFLVFFVGIELRGIPSELYDEMAPTAPLWARALGVILVLVAILVGMVRGAADGRHMSLTIVRDAPDPMGGRLRPSRWQPR